MMQNPPASKEGSEDSKEKSKEKQQSQKGKGTALTMNGTT